MKMSLSWHKERALNNKETLFREEQRIKKELEVLNRRKKDLEFYEQQIMEAEKSGKDGFDRDRYLVKKTA